MKTKPIFITVIIFLLAFAVMTSCNAGDKGVQSPMPTEDPTEEQTEEPTEKPTEEPTEEPSSLLDGFIPYVAKAEHEQFILDFLDCINRRDYSSMSEFSTPADRATDEICYTAEDSWCKKINELVVTDIRRIDPTPAKMGMNILLWAYEKNGKLDEAPEYLTNIELVESYLVCVEADASYVASGLVHNGHNDWVITLVFDDNEWGIAGCNGLNKAENVLIGMEDVHEMEEFVPPEQ